LFTNGANSKGSGVEVSAEWQPAKTWKLGAGYSWADIAVYANPGSGPNLVVPNPATPRNQWNAQSLLNLTRKIQLDAFLFYSSSVVAATLQNGPPIKPHLRGDLRLGWEVRPNWELSLSGQDLFGPPHIELQPEALTPASYVGRGVYVKSTWRF